MHRTEHSDPSRVQVGHAQWKVSLKVGSGTNIGCLHVVTSWKTEKKARTLIKLLAQRGDLSQWGIMGRAMAAKIRQVCSMYPIVNP